MASYSTTSPVSARPTPGHFFNGSIMSARTRSQLRGVVRDLLGWTLSRRNCQRYNGLYNALAASILFFSKPVILRSAAVFGNGHPMFQMFRFSTQSSDLPEKRQHETRVLLRSLQDLWCRRSAPTTLHNDSADIFCAYGSLAPHRCYHWSQSPKPLQFQNAVATTCRLREFQERKAWGLSILASLARIARFRISRCSMLEDAAAMLASSEFHSRIIVHTQPIPPEDARLGLCSSDNSERKHCPKRHQGSLSNTLCDVPR